MRRGRRCREFLQIAITFGGMRCLTILMILLAVCMEMQAQDRDFFLNGKAIQLNDSCFQLTRQGDIASVGSIWYPDKIDLRNNFDLVMEMSFGCQDLDGADGMVFGLQPVSASVGRSGEGLGIGGVRPALAVEFDTYENGPLTSIVNRLDPPFDHIAIMANGASTHSGPDNLAGPVAALANSGNIENCGSFPLRVTWDAELQTLRVYFNCELRLEYTGNVIDRIFGGDPFVYYGFAAATGGLTNTQEVCFTFNSFKKQLKDVTMCPGGRVLLDVTGGESYEWTPAAGLSSTTAASVEASPDTTTVYTVRIFDGCGIPLLDTVRITVEGDSAFVNLGPDTTLCPGQSVDLVLDVPTAIYSWSDTTLSGRSVTVSAPGTYSVTATRTDVICTAQDRLTVGGYTVPEFDIGPRDTALCNGTTLLVAAQYAGSQAYFNDGTPFDTAIVSRPGNYRYFLRHPCRVQVADLSVSYSSCRQYYLGNAFSPNGDNQNDYFFPQDGGDILRIRRFSIFDRWGAVVFSSDDIAPNYPRSGWDGSYHGLPAPVGVYVWAMETDFRDGSTRIERGDVTLIR